MLGFASLTPTKDNGSVPMLGFASLTPTYESAGLEMIVGR